MIALDAGILIALLDSDDVFHTPATAFLADHAASPLCVSALTYAESLVHPARSGRLDQARRDVDVVDPAILPLEEDDAPRVAEIRASTGLRMPDAVVVHTAEEADAELATTDQRLARAAAQRGLTVHLVGPGPATR